MGTPQKHLIASLTLLIVILLFLGVRTPATKTLAAPAPQFTYLPTPTPGPDGRIVYVAKEGDTAWVIAARYGLTLDQLRALNKWGENPIIHAGDEILLGLAGPAEVVVTPGPSPTSKPVLPTPSPVPGFGNLCVILYNDLNGDSMREEEEPSISQGAISVTDRSGEVSKTAETPTGLDPVCFEDLPEGAYNVSVAVPSGYNPTTALNSAIMLKAGDVAYVDFGAQANTITVASAPAPQGSGKSPLFAIIGAILLVGGLGLAIFAGRLVRAGSPSKKGL